MRRANTAFYRTALSRRKSHAGRLGLLEEGRQCSGRKSRDEDGGRTRTSAARCPAIDAARQESRAPDCGKRRTTGTNDDDPSTRAAYETLQRSLRASDDDDERRDDERPLDSRRKRRDAARAQGKQRRRTTEGGRRAVMERQRHRESTDRPTNDAADRNESTPTATGSARDLRVRRFHVGIRRRAAKCFIGASAHVSLTSTVQNG